MSEELKKLIQEVGDQIQPLLLPAPGHPKRIAQAHIYGMIKEISGYSYSQANPEQVKAIVKAIRKDPNGDLSAIIESAKQIYEQNNPTE